MLLLSVPLNFVTGFKLKLIHILLIKSIRSIFIHLWFSLVCRAVTAHRNKFFLWYLHNRSAVSKANFKQPNNRCKMYPELVKRLYAIPSFLKDSILVTFGILEILFSTKVHFISSFKWLLRPCILLLIKQRCLLWKPKCWWVGSSLPALFSRTNADLYETHLNSEDG